MYFTRSSSVSRKRKFTLWLCIFVCVITVVTLIPLNDYFRHTLRSVGVIDMMFRNLRSNVKTIKLPDFKPPNVGGIYSFYNVCIEERLVPTTLTYGWMQFNETQKIVVYNKNTTGLSSDKQLLFVAGSSNTQWNHWNVEMTNRSIPNTHRFLPSSAFFVAPTCASNLHHFWEDEFIRLYSVVKASNRLHPGSNNQILYRYPQLRPISKNHTICDCCQPLWSVYDDILRTLHTTYTASVYYDVPKNTCFSSAVFGTVYMESNVRQIIDHVLRELKLSYANTSTPINVTNTSSTQKNATNNNTNKNITIIQRTYRRIINTGDFVKAANELGFTNVRVLNFEEMTVLEQAATAVNTDILVGVQGAGLQWSIFMRPKSTLIEIIWPQKWWRAFYPFVPNYSIGYRALTANDVRVNWRAYELNLRKGVVCGPEERARLLVSPPATAHADSIWKWADVTIDIADFKNILKDLA